MNKAQAILELLNDDIEIQELDESWPWYTDAVLWKADTQSRRDIRQLVRDINDELAGTGLKLKPADAKVKSFGGDWIDDGATII